MEKIKKILKIIAISCIASIFLVGCGNKMYDKAMEQGKLAIANKEYDKAKASIELALEEKEDDEAKNMLLQVDNMIKGIRAKEEANIEEAIEYFHKAAKVYDVIPSIVEEAEGFELKLKELKDKISGYDDKILEAENMLKEKQYGESEDLLNEVIEETNGNQEFEVQNKKAQETLAKVNLVVAEAEKLKQEEEEAKKQELEEKKKKDVAKKKTPLDKALVIAEDSLGSGVNYYEIDHEGEIYYYFTTTDYPKVSIIVGQDGKTYDAYTYNADGVLEEF